ncbi:MAG: PorT family protein [Muribaculaceae bacterium]|nr:PorT family protein [Muribaculaceae bacterium]
MKRILTAVMAIILGITGLKTYAADFFDTSHPEDLMNLGVRFGVNTSNRNVNKDVFNVWNCNSWGTGVDLGVVAEINFRNWFSVQPGIFYESRSGKYAYVNVNNFTEEGERILMSQFGRDRSYSFIIPVMACGHFNISDGLRWNVEIGPYFQIVLKNSINGEFSTPLSATPEGLPVGYNEVSSSKGDFGIKMGSSLTILNHYLIGIHYEAGMLKPWNDSKLGGRRKAWVFSIGYNF